MVPFSRRFVPVGVMPDELDFLVEVYIVSSCSP